MIDGEALERAEKVLAMIYGLEMTNMDRQLQDLKIDRDAFENLLKSRIGDVKKHYWQAWHRMDPRIEPAMNTIFMHIFLVGVLAGRQEAILSGRAPA